MSEKRSIHDLMNLRERAAVVTGGAGHIGSIIAATLGEMGASVCVVDLDEEKASLVASGITDQFGVESLPLGCDLAQETEVRRIPDEVLDRFKRIDILVNCAAFVGTSKLLGWAVPFDQQSAELWPSVMRVNLVAPFLLTQACAEALADSGHGSVLNIGSIYGVVGSDPRLYEGTELGNPAAYAATKGGLIQLTRWLATALAPGVRVNAISPGGVWREQSDEFVSRYNARTPMGRMATEEDLKGAVAFLASDLSSYVTGHNLLIDGGWTAW